MTPAVLIFPDPREGVTAAQVDAALSLAGIPILRDETYCLPDVRVIGLGTYRGHMIGPDDFYFKGECFQNGVSLYAPVLLMGYVQARLNWVVFDADGCNPRDMYDVLWSFGVFGDGETIKSYNLGEEL